MSTPVENKKEFSLGPEDQSSFDTLLQRYPTKRSAIMPTLWIIQDRHGYISDEAVSWVADNLELSEAQVREVITFYFMYRDKPQAKYTLQVCHNISCHIMGSRSIMAHLEKKLGVRVGETTPDGMFALEGVECLGACGQGPVMQLGRHLYEHLTPEKVDEILESLKAGQPLRADTDRALEA
jgi:NADH-quinone oxidoreductase E subunit